MQFLLILLYIIDNMRNLQNTRNMQICTGKMCEPYFNMQNLHSRLMMKRTGPGPAFPTGRGVARGPVLSVLQAPLDHGRGVLRLASLGPLDGPDPGPV